MTLERVHTVVIGAGQAGLAVGYHLARCGIACVILDAHERVGDAWRRRWNSLRLFTPARYDGLPGMPFPGDPNAFPSKDEMADYLERYAARFALPVRTGVRVDRLWRDGERLLLRAGDREFEAANVVIAMSAWQRPRIPSFASELHAGITQFHAAQYRDPTQLRPGPVLIVGAGNSGYEIALDAARGHATSLSGPDTGHLPFRLDGLAARLILRRLVLRVLFHRVLTIRNPIARRMRNRSQARAMPLIRLRPGDLVAAGVTRVPRVAGVQAGWPLLEDGRLLEVANVVWCTGFSPDYSWVDLPAFRHGEPEQVRGAVRGEPGVHVLGLEFVYGVSSAMVHGVGRDAEYVARQIATEASRQASPWRGRVAAAARVLALAAGLAAGACGDAAGPAPVGWTGIAAGPSATCAVTKTHAAYCWGSGAAGQLGIGLAPDSLMTPAAVAGGVEFVSVSVTTFNACGVAVDGAGYCWGSGTFGRLGTGSWTSTTVPGALSGGHAFTSIAAGGLHGCGVAATGVAYCWGSDNYGQLGNGPAGEDSVPAPVAGGLVFTTVDVGPATSCGVAADGAAYCWGNSVPVGGDTNATAAVRVSGYLRFRTIHVGSLSTCGLTTDRRVYCWGGRSAPGVLGNGGDTASTVPVPLASPLRFVAVDAGQTHACAIADGGDAYCWGSNVYGELGTGVTGGTRLVPTLVLGGHRFTALAVGPFHTCAVTVAGEAYCWGDNRHGKLGTGGGGANSDIPVRVAGLP